MASSDNTLLVILGPTGVGKTEYSLQKAEQLGCPIINADSRQVYRDIPIGTAAPTAEQLKRVKHYNVGTLSLEEYYSASVFEQDALRICKNEFRNHDTIILTGGSMMYIDAVCNGIDEIPTVDDETRTMLKERLANEGIDPLREELRILDPQYYVEADLNNTKRIVHALEICLMTGKTYTSFRKHEKKQRPFNIIKQGINCPREELYERINNRVLQMIDNGLIEEARSVYHLRHFNSLNTVGYKELFSYFDGEIPLEEAIRQIQSNTRRYARKQLTWFKRDDSIDWLNFTP